MDACGGKVADVVARLKRFDALAFRAGAIPFLLVLVGAIPRLRQYLEARPLWLDEAQLADNILTHSVLGLFGPLDHAQVAPPGYLLLLKASVGLLGVSECAVRFPSIVMGLAALVLFVLVARKLFDDLSLVVSMAFFAVAGHLIYYSSECKPYSCDVAVALLFLWIALDFTARERVGAGRWLMLVAAGAFAPWFSLPALFSMAATGTVLGLESLWKRQWARLVALCATGMVWSGSFAALYIINIRPVQTYEVTMNYMAEYWRYGQAFMPFPPSLSWCQSRFLLFFDNPGGFLMTGLAGFAFLVGAVSAFGRDRRAFCLVLGPLVVALLVSATGKYPFHGRMTLFLAPCLFLLLGEGIARLAVELRGRAVWVALLLFAMLFVSQGVQAAKTTITPKSHHEINRALAHVESAWQPGDLLYMRHAEGLAYQYCRHRYRFTEADLLREPASNHTPEGMAAFVEQEKSRLQSAKRVWIIVTYDSSDVLRPYLDVLSRVATQTDRADFVGATAFAYDF